MIQQKVPKLWLVMSSLYNNRHVKHSFLACNALNINDHYPFHANNLQYTNPNSKPNYKNGFLICNPIYFYFLKVFAILGWRLKLRALKPYINISTRHNHSEKEKENMTMVIITQEIIYGKTSLQCIQNLECIDKENNITWTYL